jgi:hypothetical protein
VEPKIRELLESVDDPIHAEKPPDFDWVGAGERTRALKFVLEAIAGRPFVFDDRAQDASFFADLSIQTPGAKPRWIDTVFAVRISNFGNLFTTWAYGPERLSDDVVAKLIMAVEQAGFRYVPPSALDEVYTGLHPRFVGTGWWIRYFDYV